MDWSKPAVLRLKPGREKSLLRRHPWVFSGALDRVQGDPADGDTVRILSAAGDFLAWGAYSQGSQIRARIWSWDADETIDEAFFAARLAAAIAARRAFLPEFWRAEEPDGEEKGWVPGDAGAVRLVHAESDSLPGLIADRYGEWLSLQFLSSGAEAWRQVIVAQLAELTGAANIYERSDVDVRRLEGLPERTGVLLGETPPPLLSIFENELELRIDIKGGHKTGFYLDQRRNRLRVRQLAKDRRVLDCFCYTGGFSANAVAGGCSELTLIDASAEALELARENIHLALEKRAALQGSEPARAPACVSPVSEPAHAPASEPPVSEPAHAPAGEPPVSEPAHAPAGEPPVSVPAHAPAGEPPVSMIQGDVFQQLRMLRDRARTYDLIILDPPKFAPTTAQVERAARGYKDINLLAFKLLSPGGLLVTFSCSGGVSAELFQKIVAGAALDAGVDAQIIERLHQDVDHPVALNFPEGEYLKGLVCRVA